MHHNALLLNVQYFENSCYIFLCFIVGGALFYCFIVGDGVYLFIYFFRWEGEFDHFYSTLSEHGGPW